MEDDDDDCKSFMWFTAEPLRVWTTFKASSRLPYRIKPSKTCLNLPDQLLPISDQGIVTRTKVSCSGSFEKIDKTNCYVPHMDKFQEIAKPPLQTKITDTRHLDFEN